MELRPNTAYPKSDPRFHTANVLAALDDLVRHLRGDTREFDDPTAQALFETSAEVLDGLRTAFERYESGAEAMREPRGHQLRHAAIARTCHAAHIAEPQATVKAFFPAASRRPLPSAT